MRGWRVALSLKDQNKLPLFVVLAANVVFFYAAMNGQEVAQGDWLILLKKSSDLLPAGLGVILVGVLNAQFPSDLKAKIVFWRWTNPLPGAEAFTRHGLADARVDLNTLERMYGPLPCDPAEQNRLWFKMFKSVEKDPSVSQAHREFLFSRDYACISVMLLVTFGSVSVVISPFSTSNFLYLAALILQSLLSIVAARNHGVRLVTTVLALKGAELSNAPQERPA